MRSARRAHLEARHHGHASAFQPASAPGAIVLVDDPERGIWLAALGTGDLAAGMPMTGCMPAASPIVVMTDNALAPNLPLLEGLPADRLAGIIHDVCSGDARARGHEERLGPQAK